MFYNAKFNKVHTFDWVHYPQYKQWNSHRNKVDAVNKSQPLLNSSVSSCSRKNPTSCSFSGGEKWSSGYNTYLSHFSRRYKIEIEKTLKNVHATSSAANNVLSKFCNMYMHHVASQTTSRDASASLPISHASWIQVTNFELKRYTTLYNFKLKVIAHLLAFFQIFT